MAKTKIKFDINHFKVGDQVVQPEDDRYNPDMEIYHGTIQSISEDSVKVDWNNEFMNKHYSNVHNTSPLYLESEWEAKQSVLEEEFREISDKIRAKLEGVKTSLFEFKEMVNDSGYQLHTLRDAMEPLEEAMNHFGWSTSSLYC